MQDLFKRKLEWDEPLPKDLATTWNSMIKELDDVKQIEVPRHYFQEIWRKSGIIQLFGFCDSSETSYAEVV